ncbi:IclR family transcriptional regulator [Sphingomonas soli]|uniref:IclR family transcriptional regulator n=1 Tax=Sphingomonas soli TaxID=266127 RepID=UPI00082A882B|nr:IclR family transcriptional regulator [Sphingomonas soli]
MSTGGIQSLQRAIEILDLLAESGSRGARLSDLAAATGLGKSTVHRMLGELMRGGMLDQDPATKYYRVGSKLIRLGERASRGRQLGDLAQPALRRIAEQTGDTAYLSVRVGNKFVCMGREVGGYPVKVLSLEVGEQRPLGLGAGSLALLAMLDPRERDAIIAANAAEMPDNPALAVDEMNRCVSEALKLGYARTEGRVVTGIAAIAVPVFDASGTVAGSLSLQAISSRLSSARTPELVALLAREALSLSREMGAPADKQSKLVALAAHAPHPSNIAGNAALVEGFA